MEITEIKNCIKKGELIKKYDDVLAILKNFDLSVYYNDIQIEELLIEIRAILEEEKEWSKLMNLIQFLKVEQVTLYENYHYLFINIVFDYHCFQAEFDQLESDLTYYILAPDIYFTKLMLSLKKALYYKEFVLVESVIDRTFSQLNLSDKVVDEESLYDLAVAKYYSILLRFFIKWTKTKKFDRIKFNKEISEYGYNLGSDSLDAIEYGLLKSPEEREEYLALDTHKNTFLMVIECMFLRKMLLKGFGFMLSGTLWSKLGVFLMYQQNIKKSKSNGDYIKVDLKLFQTYLLNLSTNMLEDNTSEMVAILWSSIYIYDFFYEINLIDETEYKVFLNANRTLKGEVIFNEVLELWNYNFVHQWEKPDSVSEVEFEMEANLFQKSYQLSLEKLTSNTENVFQEMVQIDNLSEYIEKASGNPIYKVLKNKIIDDKIQEINNEFNIEDEVKEKTNTFVSDLKIGRNDPCHCGSGKKFKKCCG